MGIAAAILIVLGGGVGGFVANRARAGRSGESDGRTSARVDSAVLNGVAPESAAATHPLAGNPDSAHLAAPTTQATMQQATPRPSTPDSTRVRVDTVRIPAAPSPRAAPETPAASTPPVDSSRRAGRRAAALSHAWLRANGDSGAVPVLPPNASDADRIHLMADEVRGHMARAGQYLSQADVQRLRAEVRDVQADVAIMHQLYPAAADSLRVDQQVRQAVGRLFQACPAVLADTSKHFPPNFKCEQLLGGIGRGRQGAGGFVRRPPTR